VAERLALVLWKTSSSNTSYLCDAE